MKATKMNLNMNLNNDTKVIRNYTNAFNYRDAEQGVLFFGCILIPLISMIMFMNVFDLEKNNFYEAIKSIKLWLCLLFGYVSLVTIYGLLKLNFIQKFVKFLNRIFFKIDNQYAKLIIDAAFIYDYNLTVQNAMRQLIKHISSPYFNQEMADEVMVLDNCTTMLIDEDLKNNPKQISKSCYDMIYNETKQLDEKFNLFKNQYNMQQELLRKQHAEHLEDTLMAYKNTLNKQDEQYLL